MAIKVANNPTRALEFAVDQSTAAATRNPKAIAATAPSVHTPGDKITFRKKTKEMLDHGIILHKNL